MVYFLTNVIPLYKADDPILFNHCRPGPVLLLSVLSNVFEKSNVFQTAWFLRNIRNYL